MYTFVGILIVFAVIFFIKGMVSSKSKHDEIAYTPNKNNSKPKEKRKPITAVDATVVETELPQYDASVFARLPKNIIVTGTTGNEYDVNLASLSCTCPDFIKRREGFSDTDCRRICKHIAKTITSKNLNTKITQDRMLRAFVRKASANERGVPPFQKLLHVKINEKVRGPGAFYVLWDKNSLPWLDVIVFTEKTYTRDGFNIEESRWAYGENPFPDGSKTKYSLAVQKAAVFAQSKD